MRLRSLTSGSAIGSKLSDVLLKTTLAAAAAIAATAIRRARRRAGSADPCQSFNQDQRYFISPPIEFA